MRTAYIHIGMHKTGSTSIQHSLAKGEWPEHHYIRQGAPNHSVTFTTVFEDEPNAVFLRENGYSPAQMREMQANWGTAIEAELKANEKPNVVFSGESMSIATTAPAALERLRDMFAPHVDRIRVIGYVRPPVSLIQSAFQQHVKAGRVQSVEPGRVYYRARLEKFDQVFGRDNVELVKFDRASLHDGDVVLDFAKRIGLEMTPEQSMQGNVSLSLEAVALLFVRSLYGYDFGAYKGATRDRNAVREAISGYGSGKLRFAASLVDPVLKHAEAEIAWLEERMGQPMRDRPGEGEGLIASNEDLLAVAASHEQGLHDLLVADLERQADPVQRVAEMLDMMRIAQMRRNAQTDEKGAPISHTPQQPGAQKSTRAGDRQARRAGEQRQSPEARAAQRARREGAEGREMPSPEEREALLKEWAAERAARGEPAEKPTREERAELLARWAARKQQGNG